MLSRDFWREARNEPEEKHRQNHSQRTSDEKKAQKEPQPRSGENPRQNHSPRACGDKNEVKQHGYEDSEITRKIWSDDEKNREEQSQQQAQEQSQQQAQEQSEQQAKANQRTATETRRSTRRSTVQKKAAASDADVRQEQGEVNTTIQKIDFNDEIVEMSSRQLRSSDTESPEDRDGFSQLEAILRRVAEHEPRC